MGGHQRVAYRIMITLRFRVRYWREIRRVKCESVKGFEGRECSQNQDGFVTCCFYKRLNFLVFPLDRNNIGCPEVRQRLPSHNVTWVHPFLLN